jgi:hypothetical protein
MPVAEKRALTEIVLWSMALAYVWIRFTTGWELAGQSFGLEVVEQGAGRLFAAYLGIGIFASIVQVALHAYFGARGEDVEFRDERDQMIESRANQVAYWTGVAILNVIIIHVIANAAFGRGRELPLDLASPTGIAFALLAALLLQEIVRNAALLALYRRV